MEKNEGKKMTLETLVYELTADTSVKRKLQTKLKNLIKSLKSRRHFKYFGKSLDGWFWFGAL